jgi:hypothetical protein
MASHTGIVLVAHWCHVHPLRPRLIGSQQRAVRIIPGTASRRQPIHAASHDLNCCLTLATDGIIIRQIAILLISPPEPQIVGRYARDGHVKWAAVRALVCMHAGCTLTITRHGRHSTARKRAMLQNRRFRKGPQPHQRSIGSICMRASLAAVKRRPAHHLCSTTPTIVDACCPITTLFAGSETPHALRDTSRGRVRTAKAALLAHQNNQTSGYNNNIINIENSTASPEMYYVQAYRFS